MLIGWIFRKAMKLIVSRKLSHTAELVAALVEVSDGSCFGDRSPSGR